MIKFIAVFVLMISKAAHPRAVSRFAPSHGETSLQSNAVSLWLGANLESVLIPAIRTIALNEDADLHDLSTVFAANFVFLLTKFIA